jgi:hypothetical protein
MGLKDIISSVTNGKTSATDNLEKLKVGGVSTSDAKFPKTPGDIKLGMMVQDSLTGCFGTASSRHNMSSGNIQFGVQPVGDGVNYPEAWSFDWNQLLILGDHLSARAAKPASIKLLSEIVQKTKFPASKASSLKFPRSSTVVYLPESCRQNLAKSKANPSLKRWLAIASKLSNPLKRQRSSTFRRP